MGRGIGGALFSKDIVGIKRQLEEAKKKLLRSRMVCRKKTILVFIGRRKGGSPLTRAGASAKITSGGKHKR